MDAADTRTFEVRGMTCATCAKRVERALSKIEGVERCEVDLVRERARVTSRADVTTETLVQRVEALGYGLAPIDVAAPARARSLRPESSRAGIALVLAALAMGAAMIPGVPGAPWLEIVLAALATFGPGWPILRKAAREAVAREASMDTLVAIGALAALGVSLAIALRHLGHAMHVHTYAETAAMIVAFVLTGRALEERAKQRATAAIRALAALRPTTARVVRHGVEAVIPASELRPGDEARVGAHERIPADGTVLEGEAWIDESWLTGESVPVRRAAGDRVLAGTLAAGTALRIAVIAAGEGTELARVERLVERAQASRAPIVRVADRVSAVFVPVMIAIAGVTALSWWLLGRGVEPALIAGVSVLVVACPCALGLATPTAITVAIGRAARHGILVRDAAAIEALARVQVVALDKTGTLTEGRPELVRAHGIAGQDDVAALRLAAAVELLSEHPIARAIVDGAMAKKLDVPDAHEVIATPGVGVRGIVEGHAVEVRSIDETIAASLDPAARASLDADRADASTVVLVRVDERPAALCAVRDVLREGSADAIAALRALGLDVHLLSGDHASSARAIAHELGLREDEVRAGMRPEDKSEALASLRARGPVAMVGDGVNDAPALAAADVGIAMGSGAAAAVESAGVTLAQPAPARIAEAVALARATMRVVRQNLGWAFGYNLVAVPFAALGGFGLVAGTSGPALAAGAMAMSSVTVVLNSLRLGAQRLGRDRDMP
ncbi:heavy metal translocating P-type ATPase [Sandaracinus amylolyticus]|uniref:Lead, cadmium, zinc and mercury transporting ATPase n=1 Tax=Sandaracinus amylolyticus TaxID=927083 RepID=A0A0F6W6X8_9BACT|nr:heavy metal translocating P-type ATPase [Sandaracinus amylolyticus]AKF09056.1 Lead, cadmium, zinc and mercury transporting ATPase [Sandaracinus amylolyticus]